MNARSTTLITDVLIVEEQITLSLDELCRACGTHAEQLAALVDEGDYFALLGVHRGATGYEIRRAFLDLRRKFEPSRALRPRTLDLKDDLRRILDVLDEAYEILGDTPRRERYLHALELPPA